MPRIQDLTGQRFSRLLVQGMAPERRGKHSLVHWICLCDCGNITWVAGGQLKSGRAKSCSCYNKDRLKEVNAGRLIVPEKHGHSRAGFISPTYVSWCAMKQRCNYEKNKFYKDYGGRGIKCSPEFATFEGFLASVGERPEGMTLDRLDTNGDYEPSNVRWATPAQQAINNRRNRRLEFRGETLTIAEWSRRLPMKRKMIESRLRAGWSVERTLTEQKNW